MQSYAYLCLKRVESSLDLESLNIYSSNVTLKKMNNRKIDV